MTIIAAASWNGEAYIGCDRAGTDGWGTQGDYGLKVKKLPFGMIGWCGSYRAGQVLERALLNVAVVSGEGAVMEVVDKVEEALKAAGWSVSSADGLPKCKDLSIILVTNGGEVWTIQSDLAHLRHEKFAAVGSGYQVALGAMHAMEAAGQSPGGVVKAGLAAACEIIASCANPADPFRVGGAS